MKPFIKFKTLHHYARHVARLHFGTTATPTIILSEPGTEPKGISYTPPGYRKYTTGEYVPKKYLSHFGWKNTYYQKAECTVSIPSDIYVFFQLKGEGT